MSHSIATNVSADPLRLLHFLVVQELVSRFKAAEELCEDIHVVINLDLAFRDKLSWCFLTCHDVPQGIQIQSDVKVTLSTIFLFKLQAKICRCYKCYV